MNASSSRLTRALGLAHPITQAPVGGAAGPELAAAVARAGALGALPLTWTRADDAARLVDAVRALAGGAPFQCNFVLAFAGDALDATLGAALDAGAPVITFSWGDAAPYVERVRAAGARLGVQVTSADEARRAASLGVDYVICQGIEAGGHVESSTSLWELLPRVVDAAGAVPVAAAGGIGDGAAIARALGAGAAAAVLGTRFVATRESRAHGAYKRALVDAASGDAVLTTCFDGGWPDAPHRALRNATLDGWERAGRPSPGARPGEGDVLGAKADGSAILRYDDTSPRDDMSGDAAAMALYAGTSCEMVRDVPSVAELMERLVAQMHDASSGTASRGHGKV